MLTGGGADIPVEEALSSIAGITLGLDLTLRDLQTELKNKGKPWELSKSFDGSAPPSVTSTSRSSNRTCRRWNSRCTSTANCASTARPSEMLYPVAQQIAILSQTWALEPGDVVFTGTPKGVAEIKTWRCLRAGIAVDRPLRVALRVNPAAALIDAIHGALLRARSGGQGGARRPCLDASGITGIGALPTPVWPDAAVPGRPDKPDLIRPRDVPTRGLGTVAGRAALIHAVSQHRVQRDQPGARRRLALSRHARWLLHRLAVGCP